MALLLLAACDLPHDPEDTLDEVRGGVMEVGVSHAPPWVVVANGNVSGIEPALAQRLADALGAEVEWVQGAESDLLERLERFELDLVIAGLTADGAWKRRVAFTRPYVEVPADIAAEPGQLHTERHVWAVPPGENGWLVLIERFLKPLEDEVRQALTALPGAPEARP